MRAIILRIFGQMWNDKRSLALILFAPILLMTLMYLVFGESSYVPKVAALGLPQQMTAELEKQDIKLEITKDTPDSLLKDRLADGVLYIEDGQLRLKMYEPDSVKSQKITKAVSEALKKFSPASQEMKVSFLLGDADAKLFDRLAYVFLGIVSFMFVFLISGISFIRERTLGTMERFMLTPIRRFTVVTGYVLGFGFFAILQSVLVVLYAKYVLDITVGGSLFYVMLIMVLLSFVAVTAGAVVSVFANNEFQVVQFIPLVIVPQIFFSGLIPVETLPYSLDKLAYVMPVYYACHALKDVLLGTGGFTEIWIDCLILLGFVLVLMIANVLLLKRYRTI